MEVTDRMIVAMYVDDNMSVAGISKKCGCGVQKIRSTLERSGVSMRPRGPLPGEMHPNWKGGTTVDNGGYILSWAPNHPDRNVSGYVRYHRLVAEKMLGRRLGKKEVVHHIDGDPSNNNQSNLEVYETNGQHLAEELRGRCPNWSQDGKARMQAAVDKRKKLPDDAKVLGDLCKTNTPAEIAVMYGVSRSCVLYTMKRLQIPLMGTGYYSKMKARRGIDIPDKESLARMYKDESAESIARKLGCNPCTVRALLSDYGIPSHKLGYHQKKNTRAKIDAADTDLLSELYEKNSSGAVGKMFGCSGDIALKVLHERGIRIRKKGERLR